MPQTTTVIFLSTTANAIWAIKYSQHHPLEKIRLFPTDISALLYLLETNPQSISRIDTFVKPNRKLNSAIFLPLKIAQEIISTNSQLKLWVDVLRSELVKSLSHYYILHRITRRTRCHKIITSSSALHLPALRQFAQDHRLAYQIIPQTQESLYHRFIIRLSIYLEPVRWFLFHPQEVPLFLRTLLPTLPKKPRVLIFSNGLNLASYHSVIKTLTNFAPVKIITDRQNFKDRLYLGKYGLTGQELKHHNFTPSLNKSITIFTKSRLWFISSNNLKRLIKRIVAPLVMGSSAKILAKYRQAQQHIKTYKPRLLITTHDPGPSGLAFVTAAQEQKVNTLVLLHGSPSSVHYFYSNAQLIWGPLMRQWLVRDGLSVSKLKLGGYPIYSDYLNYFRHHNIKPTQPTIGIITTGDGRYEWHQAYYFLDLFKALSKLTIPLRILIRTHPMQGPSSINQLAHYFGLTITLNPPLHLEEFIAQCDIVITQNSTAALVPLIARKPTILLDPWFPFLDEGLIKESDAFLQVKHWSELPNLINQLFHDKKLARKILLRQQRFITDYCGTLNSKTGFKIAKTIQRLIT